MKKNLLYTFLLAALATSCTDEGFMKQGGSSEQASGNGSKVYIQNFLQEPDSVDVQALVTRGVVETNPDVNGVCQAEWLTTQVEDDEIDIYELGDGDKFTYFATAKLHKDSKIEDHSWEGYNSWFGETMDFIDYRPGKKYIAVCGTKAINDYSKWTFDPYNPTLNFDGQKSYPEDNRSINLDYDFMVSNLVQPEWDDERVKATQPDFHFNHIGALVKYNLYNLPADKKITKIIVSSPTSNFMASDGSAIPLGFHVTAPFPLVWDTDNPNGNNCYPDYLNQMKYYTSATAPLEVTICDEDETIGRAPESVSSSDKYADYQTKLTASFFTTEALFSDGLTRRKDALVVRAVAEDGSEYVCVTSEDADAYLSGRTYIRNVVMQPDNVTLAQTSGYVDLGLPSGTLWDAVNFGAVSPEYTGNYYAWGETGVKTSYNWGNYKHASSGNITKYTAADNKLLLESTDDIFEKSNPNNSLPTQEQIRELVFKCRWQEVYYKGTVGSLVTGPNGNQIFIPYAGYKDGTNTLYQSAHAYLWSKSFRGFDTMNDEVAGVLHAFGEGKRNNYSLEKAYGCPVRCVRKKAIDFNGHDYVDLGLPSRTYWAKMNVGATSPEDIGYRLAWGETEPKDEYTWDNYKYFDQYNSNGGAVLSKYGSGQHVLDPEDDAATVHLGGDWKMPTYAALGELYSNCYWEWTDNYNETNTSGYIVYALKSSYDKGVKNTRNSGKTPVGSYSITDAHIFLPVRNENRNYYWTSNSVFLNSAIPQVPMLYVSDQEVRESSKYFTTAFYLGNSVRAIIR